MDIMADELQERIEAGENVPRIDVREPYEHEEFNIGGSLIPLGSLPVRLNEIPQDKDAELVMYCRSRRNARVAKTLCRKRIIYVSHSYFFVHYRSNSSHKQ